MLAGKADKERAIEIMVSSFDNNPGIDWIIKNSGSRENRKRHLAEFLFETAVSINGIFLSADRNGIAVFFRFADNKPSLRQAWNKLKLALNCVGLSHALQIMKREKHIRSIRPADGNYLYFWFFGVMPAERGNKGGAGSGLELKNEIISESVKRNLPIYLETTILQNKKIYERYGFKVYHEWFVEQRNITLWFMKREPR